MLFIIKVSIVHQSSLHYVFARKDLCFATGKQVDYKIMLFCLKSSEDPHLKSDISGFIQLQSVIQMVKYSFFNQGFFIKGSIVRCLRLVIYFLFKEKFCALHTPQSAGQSFAKCF